MKRILLIATLLTAAAFSGLAGAGEISSASQDKLLMVSGIHDMVAQFPGLLRLRMEQARQRDKIFHTHPGMSDEDYQEMENTMVDAFKPADIMRAIGKQVSASVSEQDAEKMLAWYDSDLGKKISKAEDESSTPEAYRDMARSAKSLLADKQRVAFAIKLDNLLHMTDMSMHFQVNAAVAMLVAFSTRKNEHRPANQKAFRKRISAGLEKERYKIRRGVILSTVYTYRKIDKDSLEKYGAFLKTPAALRFNEALMAGMDTGLTQAIDRMARSLETLFKQKQLQQV
jgi:Uncharacterized protein conserved in bacteria (DUF2059)